MASTRRWRILVVGIGKAGMGMKDAASLARPPMPASSRSRAPQPWRFGGVELGLIQVPLEPFYTSALSSALYRAMTWNIGNGEQGDPLSDLSTDRLDRLMAFRNGLVALCEGWAKMDETVYATLRREFMNDPVIAPLLPQFVRAAQDRGAMWAFMKDYDGQWEPRRQMVRKAFAPLVDALERGSALADTLITDGIASFDALGITDAWNKALARRDADPAGAITAARTLLETVCKHLLEDEIGNPQYGPNDDLPKLYRTVSERLNIAPSQHSEDAFKRILGSAASVVEGLGTLRNKIGDAHAPSGRKPVKVAPRHAALAANLAGSMALFLIETASAKGLT